MAVQRHNVVISKSGGGVEVYPMKDWFREHPEENPTGARPRRPHLASASCCTAEGGMVNKTDGN
jgi:hypothetical protein